MTPLLVGLAGAGIGYGIAQCLNKGDKNSSLDLADAISKPTSNATNTLAAAATHVQTQTHEAATNAQIAATAKQTGRV